MRRTLWFVALGLHAAGLGLFVAWLSRTDLLFGHFRGSLRILGAAAIVAGVALAASVAFLFSGRPQAEPRKLWQPALMVALCLASAVVIPVAISERRGEADRIGRLVEALRSPEEDRRQMAATTLWAMGPRAAPAEELLRELERSDPSEKVRTAAREAILSIHGQQYPPRAGEAAR